MKHSILFVLFSFWMSLSNAAAPIDTFKLANQALLQKNYYDAIQLYESIQSDGYYSMPLYYNLGTAYLKSNQIAPARLNFERGLYIEPLNKNIATNLESIRNRISDNYPFPKYPFFSTIASIHSYLGHRVISIVLWMVFLGLLISWFLYRTRQRHIYKWSALICLIFVLSMSGLFIVERTYQDFHRDMSILYEDEVSLYEAPDIQSNILSTISKGYKLRIEDVLGEFTKVSLGDGSEGWIKSKQYTYILRQKKS